jgi:hypothetical protein
MNQSFQGSGFVIELPAEVLDASSYVFVKPDPSPAPATLRISPTPVDAIPADLQGDLEAALTTEAASIPALSVQQISTNKRDNWTYGFVTLAWEFDELKINERRIYLYIDDEPLRHFVFTIQAMADQFEDAMSYFSESLRSFAPNDDQFFASPAAASLDVDQDQELDEEQT